MARKRKKVIHVHQQKLRKGENCIIVRDYQGSKHYKEIEIEGPVKVIYSDEPDRCGARVWIETYSDVKVIQ